jgi:hypothetical protein
VRFEAFRQKFGRLPGPNEPLFFDPLADFPVLATTEEICRQLIAASAAIGIEAGRLLRRLDMSPGERPKALPKAT